VCTNLTPSTLQSNKRKCCN